MYNISVHVTLLHVSDLDVGGKSAEIKDRREDEKEEMTLSTDNTK